jgi:hypothetical protein
MKAYQEAEQAMEEMKLYNLGIEELEGVGENKED